MSGLRYHPEILEGMQANKIEYLKQYEDWFIIEPEDLKRITDHFVKELEKGLTKEDGNIPMNVTWVMGYPSGHETGDVLTFDMGGTNLHVCQVCLSNRKRDFEQIQRKFKLPDEVKTGTGEQLWVFIAGRLELFLGQHNTEAKTDCIWPLSFTFSFPIEQISIRSGILQRWTKNLNVSGVEGYDVVPQLEAAFQRKKLPARIVALINDTTGTLIASHYRDPQVKVGSIISTGVNAAYMEECKFIPKIAGNQLPANSKVIINAEYGSFDNDREVLPLTSFDQQIDKESARPGSQIYEKMVSGRYMGEMLRLILIKLHEQGRLFKGLDITRLRHENSIEASFLSVTELDLSENLDDMREEFEESLSLSPELDDLKYSGFKGRAAQGLRDIFDWPPNELELIALNPSEGASGVGAALAAALILEGEQKAKPL